jgi:hypothetical protein
MCFPACCRSPCSMGLHHDYVGGDSIEPLRKQLHPYLADAIRDEIESHTPLIIDSHILEHFLITVTTCRGCN